MVSREASGDICAKIEEEAGKTKSKTDGEPLHELCTLTARRRPSNGTIGRWGELPHCLPILVSLNSAVYLGIDKQTPHVGPQ
ncbi:hypothetical protein AB1N83_012987 [Pleurotus pulmonarius]